MNENTFGAMIVNMKSAIQWKLQIWFLTMVQDF